MASQRFVCPRCQAEVFPGQQSCTRCGYPGTLPGAPDPTTMPPPMSGPVYPVYTFMIQRMGTEEGPYSAGDLQMQARSGMLKGTTPVRRADGAGGWFAAGDVPGVFSDKEWLPTLLISFFLGSLGIDRFYLGYTGLGVLKLITFGGCGIWTLIDLIRIATGSLPDAKGLPLKRT